MPKQSQKTRVIEHIFDSLWEPGNRTLSRTLVTMVDVGTAIAKCNEVRALEGKKGSLSTRNIANFFKDLKRSETSFRRNWPKSVLERGYIGEQSVGAGNSFRFVPAPPDYGTALPSTYPRLSEPCVRLDMQSVELPLAIRSLRRRDETWLLQLAVRLNIVEMYLGVVSTLKIDHVSFLQMGIKGTVAEIDALYIADLSDSYGDKHKKRALITVEAKGTSEDIVDVQVRNQVVQALKMKEFADTVGLVIPLAVKAIGESQLYIAEYEAIARAQRSDGNVVVPSEVSLQREAIFRLKPHVAGI